VFLHIKQLPELYKELAEKADIKNARAVGVSVRPRNVDGSYMPVFTAGEAFARVIADTLGVPLYTYSHQDGHIMAAVMSSERYELLERGFLAVHLSGGTTEILTAEYDGHSFSQEIVGGTKDISAGQLIDRVGVAMGFSFPCGAEMEKMAETTESMVKLPISTDGAYMNFSGTETKAIRMVDASDGAEIAKGVIDAAARTLARTVGFAAERAALRDVILAGGVTSNRYIKEFLKNNINANIYFAEPSLSADNAVGIAKLTQTEVMNGAENSDSFTD
jgi:N6-L-threonylcarbamoyladenine synthase